MTVSEARRLKELEAENTQAEEAAGGSGARQSGVEGSAGPKMVSPQAKREAVEVLMTERGFGVTRACGLVGISRSLYRLSKSAAGLRAAARAASARSRR